MWPTSGASSGSLPRAKETKRTVREREREEREKERIEGERGIT
jgi:hypothetical protein